MSSETSMLCELFEKASELRVYGSDISVDAVDGLNKEITEKNLFGRLVVFALPDDELPEAYQGRRHSHMFSSGRLGGFALREADEDDDEKQLVAVVKDVRGVGGFVQYLPVEVIKTPYDIASEQLDEALLMQVRELIESPNFSFVELSELCKKVTNTNLGYSLFITALNDMYLPHNIASKIYVPPSQVQYFHRGRDIGPPQNGYVGYGLGIFDMFSLKSWTPGESPSLYITDMIPESPMGEYRNILIDHDVRWFDKA